MSLVNPPLRTIRLSGQLGKRYGKVHRFALDTNTTAEAMAALMSQHAGLDEYLIGSKDRGIGYAVFIGSRNIGEDELTHPAGNEDIRIAPVILGSKNGGVFSIILGAVLVVVGAIGAYTPFGQAYGGAVWGPYVMAAGYSMMAGGVVQLLTPMPKGLASKDKAANTPSYAFNGPINTEA
jgi:predicted phage tail protein